MGPVFDHIADAAPAASIGAVVDYIADRSPALSLGPSIDHIADRAALLSLGPSIDHLADMAATSSFGPPVDHDATEVPLPYSSPLTTVPPNTDRLRQQPATFGSPAIYPGSRGR